MDEDQSKLEKKIKTKYKKLIPYKVYIPDHSLRGSLLRLNMTDLCYKDEAGAIREIQSNTSYADMYYEIDLPSITSSDKILNKMVSSDYSYIINGLQMELFNYPKNSTENDLYFCVTMDIFSMTTKRLSNYNMYVCKYIDNDWFKTYDNKNKCWTDLKYRLLAWSKI
jgi:hypothetical protein